MGNQTEGKAKDKGKEKGKKIVIVLLVLIVIALAGVIIYLLTRKAPEPPEDDRNRGTVVTEDNVDNVITGMEEQEQATPMGRYEVVQSMDWHFADPDAVSTDAYVENAKSNHSTVYFTIGTSVNDSDVFYTSPDIPVGSHLEDISLDGALETGKHDCVLTYHLLDDNGEEKSDVSLALTIYVGP